MNELTTQGPLWLYFVLVAGIIVLPGMDMAFVMASSLVGGRRGGAMAVAGIVAGGIVHVAMGALGVGLLLVSTPRLFQGLLIAGSVYVAWMGWSLVRGATALGEVRTVPSRPPWSTFRRAVLTCLLNPKAYVFMIAVFPQFLRVDPGAVFGRTVALSAITGATQLVVYGGVALAAVQVRGWLAAHGAAQVWLGRSVGMLLIAAAAWTVWRG